MDLVPIITAMGLATENLGLGATYSTTYYSPFHVARLFASLDHFTHGRIAWNVVTLLNDSEAQNFGVQEHLEHDDRYDVAETSWRPRVRCGTPGKTGPCCWTKNRGNLPTLRRYTVWTTREIGSR